MLTRVAFRLRPPLRFIPSRGYISPFFSRKPLARPYYWWLKARYRPDGTRRSILLGIIHGVFYVSVAVYAYRQYPVIKAKEDSFKPVSRTIELQRINSQYKGSAFTEPAEIKAYIAEIGKFATELSEIVSDFIEEYDILVECVPGGRERVRKSVIKLHEILAMPNLSSVPFLQSMVKDVETALLQLQAEMHCMLVTKRKQETRECREMKEKINNGH